MPRRTEGPGWTLNSTDQTLHAQTPGPPGGKKRIRIALEKRKKGKMVTRLHNLVLPEKELRELAFSLKTDCGVGGTIKAGTIELQGDCRDRVRGLLAEKGYAIP